MAYCTKTDVENYLQVSIDDTLDTQITAWIAAVTAYINRYTDRNFEASTAIKKFDGNARGSLAIDDVLSVSAVFFTANDSTSDAGTQDVPTTEFHLSQDGDANKTPYNKIILPRGSSYGVFPWGSQNIWIDGSFGYAATCPADITVVATKLVASLVNVGKNDQVSQYGEADLSVSYVPFDKLINSDLGVKEILDFYKGGSATSRFFTGSALRV